VLHNTPARKLSQLPPYDKPWPHCFGAGWLRPMPEVDQAIDALLTALNAERARLPGLPVVLFDGYDRMCGRSNRSWTKVTV
jgi:hypothetical protein